MITRWGIAKGSIMIVGVLVVVFLEILVDEKSGGFF